MSSKAWRLANPEKFRAQQRRANAKNVDYRRNHHYQRRYGISLAHYEAMEIAQDGLCAICRKPPGQKRLHVDHDHATGRVRGLLCRQCNTAIGHLEATDWRQQAEFYLAHPPHFIDPERGRVSSQYKVYVDG